MEYSPEEHGPRNPIGLSLEQRLQRGTTRDENGCLLWHGTKLTPDGYARFTWQRKKQLVHRVVWAEVNGEIPETWQVDHLCRVRNCVEITHLEAVTSGENLARSSKGFALTGYCVSGKHRMASEDDMLVRAGLGRTCRWCYEDRLSEWRQANRDRVNAERRAKWATRKLIDPPSAR